MCVCVCVCVCVYMNDVLMNMDVTLNFRDGKNFPFVLDVSLCVRTGCMYVRSVPLHPLICLGAAKLIHLCSYVTAVELVAAPRNSN